MSSLPISDYGLLSDCHTAALVSGDGSIDWLCLPRFDSPSVFGRILDPGAGHWSIRPAQEFDVRRRYLDGSLVLETQFTSPTGMAMLTDALLFGMGKRGHDIGADSPHILARVVETTEGSMDFVAEFCPRPEYGLVRPRLEVVDGALMSRGGAEVLMVAGPAPDETGDGVARWAFTLGPGERVAFAMYHLGRASDPPKAGSDRQTRRHLEDTVKGWQSWSDLHQGYDGPAQTLVRHSGRVLYGLTYQPTGAVIAAPTTSLAETPGGGRNWDYRYAWVRDTSFTLNALWVAACPHEAERYVGFLVDTAGTATGQPSGPGGQRGVEPAPARHLR